jgi:ADP-ribosyl-[dinitrogen reductase] hydrolase
VENKSGGLQALIELGVLPISAEEVRDLQLPGSHAAISFDRIEGMLLGLAVGDSLGNTSESLLPSERRASYGEIRDYLPNFYADGKRAGLPSDDTQMAFWTLEHLLESGRIIPDGLARIFASRQIFGMGRTVGAFRRSFNAGRPWHEAAQPSAGNGALMRIAPVVIPHAKAPSALLWEDAIMAGAVTHNDCSSIGACVAFAGMLVDLLATTNVPSADWWLDTYCSRARLIEGDVQLRPRKVGLEFTGPIWQLVETYVRRALKEDLAVLQACEQWYSGAFLLETVPSVLFILARHSNDPEEAIVRAVNDTRDNDTMGAIVGAAMGALHGRNGLPERWISGLTGRTSTNDDGRVFELIRAAKQKWGPWPQNSR